MDEERAESMASDAGPAYHYIPLVDPTQQIRLIQLLPPTHNELPSLRLLPVHVADLPRYAAISYTWGDSRDNEPIDIDGCILSVGKNCHHVLWQLQLHSAYRYYWIDAICIDQSNADEKGPQVQMMGDIYEQSDRVFACFGGHDDDSESLFAGLRALDTALQASGQKQEKVAFARGLGFEALSPAQRLRTLAPAYIWIATLGSVELLDLTYALRKFAQRNYWRRVWIVQELALAPCIELLCGDAIAEYDVLLVLFHELEACMASHAAHDDFWSNGNVVSSPCHAIDDHPCIGHPDTMMGFRVRTRTDFGTLPGVLGGFTDFGCSDRRDRVYGFLRLVQWPDQLRPVTADYSISVYQLAMIMFQYYEPEWEGRDYAQYPKGPIAFARRVLQGLRLDGHDLDLRVDHEQRKASYVSALSWSTSHDLHLSTVPAIDSHERSQFWSKPRGLSAVRLSDDGNGSLQAPISAIRFGPLHPDLIQTKAGWQIKTTSAPKVSDRESWEIDKWKAYQDFTNGVERALAPRRIMNNGRLIGLACSTAGAEDFIVDLSRKGDGRRSIAKGEGGPLWLVVRHVVGQQWRILGHALLSSREEFCTGDEWCKCSVSHKPQAMDWDFSFDSRDLLGLLCPPEPNNKARDFWSRDLSRLIMSVTREPWSSYAIALPRGGDSEALSVGQSP